MADTTETKVDYEALIARSKEHARSLLWLGGNTGFECEVATDLLRVCGHDYMNTIDALQAHREALKHVIGSDHGPTYICCDKARALLEPKP